MLGIVHKSMLIALTLGVPAMSQLRPPKSSDLEKTLSISTTTAELNVNRMTICLDNVGGTGQQTFISSWDGWNTQYAYESIVMYDQGLWILGKRNGVVGCLPKLWFSPYSPGPIINGQPALKANPQDAYRYKTYRIARGETAESNRDYAQWPSDLGAPVDSTGKPRILGDQMVWAVYNGADTTLISSFFRRNLGPLAILPVEVRQSAFEHFGDINDTSIWANTTFFEWAIINKGSDPIDSMYLALWTDLDFLDSFRNFPAVDTQSQTGYCWYGTDSTLAAVGYTLVFGPSVPSANDTAVFFGGKRAGYRNFPLSSFWGIADDSYPDSSGFGPPYSVGTAWNVLRGLNQRGLPIIDSTTKLPTKFPYAGDPLTHTGALYPFRWSGGMGGFMMTTGPVTLAPGDSQWIMIAVIPAAKWNGIDAITRMRLNAQYLRSLPYDSLVTWKSRWVAPTKPLPTFETPTSFAVYHNFPNPFNSATVVPFDLPEVSDVRVEVFDILGRQVAALGNQILAAGKKSVTWYSISSSGVYFIRVKAVSMVSPRSWSGMQKVMLLK